MSSTRVVHARFSEETLLSIMDYYEKFGPDAQMGVTTKVPLVLTACMKSLREAGVLPTHPADTISDGLQAAIDNKPGFSDLPIIKPLDVVLEDIIEKGSEDDMKEVRHKLTEAISQSIAAVTQPEIELDDAVWEPDPEDLPDSGKFELNIADQKKLESWDIPEDDPYYSKAVEEEDEAAKLAIEIAYYHVHPTSYSSEEARQLIQQLTPHCERYLGEGDE